MSERFHGWLTEECCGSYNGKTEKTEQLNVLCREKVTLACSITDFMFIRKIY